MPIPHVPRPGSPIADIESAVRAYADTDATARTAMPSPARDDDEPEITIERSTEPGTEPERTGLARGVAKVGFAALAYGAGALGGLTMRGRGRPDGLWFRLLRKPKFQPPNWLFGPVWTALYGAMAASAYLVWRAPASPARTRALALWGTQLALNAAWTPLFFGARRPALALVDIAALDAAATAYVVAAREVDPKAAALVAPYLAWLGYASALNGAIVAKNR